MKRLWNYLFGTEVYHYTYSIQYNGDKHHSYGTFSTTKIIDRDMQEAVVGKALAILNEEYDTDYDFRHVRNMNFSLAGVTYEKKRV